MNEERLLTILQAPCVSEKTVRVDRQYVFKVIKDATKPEVKAAVENLFDVKVDKVRISIMKPKQKRFGQIIGKRKSWKKAYVKLAQGSEIDIAGTQS